MAASLALMFWSGAVAHAVFGAASEDVGYRQVRDAVPWKYLGYLIGGFTMVFATTCIIEGKVTARRALTSLVTVLLFIAIFDGPFDNILLPPNGDW